MGDLGDIVNAATAVATVMDSNVARAMPARAHAIPRGVDAQAGLRDWAPDRRRIAYRHYATSAASRAGIASPTQFDMNVQWMYAGTVGGYGRFIREALVYVEIGSIGLFHDYTVTAKFDDTGTFYGDPRSPVAVLGGQIDVFHEYWNMTEDSFTLNFTIRGDGSGEIG